MANNSWLSRVKSRFKNRSSHLPEGFEERWKSRGKFKRVVGAVSPLKAASEKVGSIKEKYKFLGGMFGDLLGAISSFVKFAYDTILILFNRKTTGAVETVDDNLSDSIETYSDPETSSNKLTIIKSVLSIVVGIWLWVLFSQWQTYGNISLLSPWSMLIVLLSVVIFIMQDEISSNGKGDVVYRRMRRNLAIYIFSLSLFSLFWLGYQISYFKSHGGLNLVSVNTFFLLSFGFYTNVFRKSYLKFRNRHV